MPLESLAKHFKKSKLFLEISKSQLQVEMKKNVFLEMAKVTPFNEALSNSTGHTPALLGGFNTYWVTNDFLKQ